ncbi:MAG: DUF4115 domain-containing protein [Nitrospiraceae bacterium]|nr:DUF4115 domain-containing protein [Nitrospiraceae bacterium]
MSKILKQKREELGEELRDISLVVRIRTTYLKAIEEEDFEKLPAEVYAKGYIREYARYLNVPLKEAVAAYEQFVSGRARMQEEVEPVPAAAPEIIKAPAEPSRVASKVVSIIPKLLVFIVGAAIVFGIYIFVRDNWQTMGRDSVAELPKPMLPPAEKPVEQPQPQTDQPAPAAVQNALQNTTASNTADASKPKEPATPVKSRHNLVVSATDQVWLEINADDRTKSDIIMNAGETRNFRADGIFRIKVGNAGGVKFSFNGKDIGPLGAKGEVVSLTLPSQPQKQPVPAAGTANTTTQN